MSRCILMSHSIRRCKRMTGNELRQLQINSDVCFIMNAIGKGGYLQREMTLTASSTVLSYPVL